MANSQLNNSRANGQNYMRQFRDKNTRQLKNLTSTQFMEIWSHYDHDGKYCAHKCTVLLR